jgi:hypothetical protein
MGANNQMPCDFCGAPYDPVSTRWLCPNCHMKANCCDGASFEMNDSANLKLNNL